MRSGSIKLNSPLVQTKYLLLYDFNTKGNERLYKITGESPQIYTAQDMANKFYPNPTPDQLYMVFDLDLPEEELRAHEWSAKDLASENGSPVLVKYIDLFPPK